MPERQESMEGRTQIRGSKRLLKLACSTIVSRLGKQFIKNIWKNKNGSFLEWTQSPMSLSTIILFFQVSKISQLGLAMAYLVRIPYLNDFGGMEKWTNKYKNKPSSNTHKQPERRQEQRGMWFSWTHLSEVKQLSFRATWSQTSGPQNHKTIHFLYLKFVVYYTCSH